MPFHMPVSVSQFTKLISGVKEESSQPLNVEVIVDESLSAGMSIAAQEAFRPASDTIKVMLKTYTDNHAALLPEGQALAPVVTDQADLTIILANKSPLTADLYLTTVSLRKTVIVAENIDEFVNAWPKNLTIVVSNLIAVSNSVLQTEGYDALFANLAKWILEACPEQQLAWACGLSFIRTRLSGEIIRSTSIQNGVVAAAFFIPGADLPILLLSQLRMFFKLAAIHGIEFDGQPYREFAVLVAQGFFWRGLARRSAKLLPTLDWVVKGTVGYAGTMALGIVALVYLQELEKLDKLRAVSEAEAQEGDVAGEAVSDGTVAGGALTGEVVADGTAAGEAA